MRGNAAWHELVSPGTLAGVLALLAGEPGAWTPMAGGTEIMVAFAGGRLTARKLVSLAEVPDLRFVRAEPGWVAVGAGCTFRDLRNEKVLAAEFPLLATAATWIGSIANQSRATLGGNLVNGSPAADSSPALLVYDAEVEFISVRGTRRIPYSEFHTGYKLNLLAPDEILLAVHLPRPAARRHQYIRKVGTRRAMAISKVALAGGLRMQHGRVKEVRLAAASVAAYPVRLYRAEQEILGQPLAATAIESACEAARNEVVPLDDIRSTSEYRQIVLANLLREFLGDVQREPEAAL